MKKSLLISNVLIAAAMPAFANNAPKVELGGRMDTMYGIVKESKDYRNTKVTNPTAGYKLSNKALVNDTKIDIRVDGKINSDVIYGGLVRLHADTTVATNKESSIADKTMVYFQNDKFGRIEAGNYPSAGGQFEMDTTFLNVGAWGIEGFWTQWVQDRTKRVSATPGLGQSGSNLSMRSAEFIVSPNLVSNYSGNHYSDAPKVNFFTKPHKTITVGVSYIPDMDSSGTIAGVAPHNGAPADTDRPNNPATYRSIISGGIAYEQKFGDYAVKASITGEKGKSKVAEMRDLKAMELAGNVSYKNYTLVGSYGDWFKSLTLKTPVAGSKQMGKYKTFGFKHEMQNNISYAASYLTSKRAGGIEALSVKYPSLKSYIVDNQPNRLKAMSFDIDYKLAKGFNPYAGVTFFNFKEGSGAIDKGHVILLGSRLQF